MLTTLPTVKARLGIDDNDVKDDALLTSYIALVSARIENDCNRKFGYAAATDEFEGHETELRVTRYPIDQSQPITFDLERLASIGWESMASIEYVIRKSYVVSLVTMIGQWKNNLRISYTGGFVLPDMVPPPATTNPALPDDLVLSATEQIAYWYQNKDRLGLSHVSGSGASIAHVGKLDLLPSVQQTVQKYERWMP